MKAGIRFLRSTVSVLALSCASLLGQAPVVGGGWEVARVAGPPDPRNQGNFGLVVVAAGDLDGDGFSELAVSALTEEVLGLPEVGAVYLLSGRSGTVIWRSVGQVAGEGFGRTLAVFDDLDGDGVPEIAVGMPIPISGGSGFNPGKVVILSGANGVPFRMHTGENSGWNCSPGEAFGRSMASLDDLDGDGIDEYLIGAPYASNCNSYLTEQIGAVNLYNGRTGVRMDRFLGVGPWERFGHRIVAIPDLDGDGFADFVTATPGLSLSGLASSEGGAKAISSVTGVQITQFSGALPEERLGSAAICLIGDLGNDGIGEIALSSVDTYLPGNHDGVVKVFDGRTGLLIWQLDAWVADQALGVSLAPGGDLDRDGVPDLLVGSSSLGDGAVVIVSGASGEVAWIAPPMSGSSAYGISLVGPQAFKQHGVPVFLATGYNGDPTGIFESEFRPFLSADSNQVSASAGGLVQYQVDFPDSLALQQYALLGSFTGRGPTESFGVKIPLSVDPFFRRTADLIYPPYLTGGTGQLDASGDAMAVLAPPPGALSAWQGRMFWIAAVAFGPNPMSSSVAVHLSVGS